MNAQARSLYAGDENLLGKKYKNYVPYNENERPSVDDRRNDYLGKLDDEDYLRTDPEL